MKKLVVFCLILITSFSAFAQNKPEWILLDQKSGVKIFVKYTICDQQSIVYLKALNTTGNQVSITWKERFSMKDYNIDVNSGQNKNISLAASTSAEAKCGDDKNLKLIVNPNDYVSMAGVGFWELEIYDLKIYKTPTPL